MHWEKAPFVSQRTASATSKHDKFFDAVEFRGAPGQQAESFGWKTDLAVFRDTLEEQDRCRAIQVIYTLDPPYIHRAK